MRRRAVVNSGRRPFVSHLATEPSRRRRRRLTPEHANMLSSQCRRRLAAWRIPSRPPSARLNPPTSPAFAHISRPLLAGNPKTSWASENQPLRHSSSVSSATSASSSKAYSSSSPSSPSSQSPAQADGERPPALEKPDYLDDAESAIWDILEKEFSPTELSVQDVSGGCGSMYGIEITAESFRGLSRVKQHRVVHSILSPGERGWHGLQLRTKVPPP